MWQCYLQGPLIPDACASFISVLLELGRETDRGLNCKLSFLASSSWVTSVCTPISQRIAPKLLAILRPTYTNCRFNITQIKLSKWLSDSSSTPILNFCLAFLSGRSLSWSTLRTSVHPPTDNIHSFTIVICSCGVNTDGLTDVTLIYTIFFSLSVTSTMYILSHTLGAMSSLLFPQ